MKKYANKENSVNKLKCILVNFQDINIKSYLFNINIEKESFLKYLNEAGYFESNKDDFGIFFNNKKFVNNSKPSLMDLYGFKKIIIYVIGSTSRFAILKIPTVDRSVK